MFKKRAGPGGSLGFSAKIAHTTIMPSLVGNKDLKLLQDFITAEKAVVVDLQKLALDYGRAAETLKSWGQGEGDDLAVSHLLIPIPSLQLDSDPALDVGCAVTLRRDVYALL